MSELPVVDDRARALAQAHSYLVTPGARADGWDRVARSEDGEAWRRGVLQVIWSVAIEQDGRPWLHASMSRPDRLPNYDDMARLHRVFVGADRYAYEVRAPRALHVNIHDRALHLWAVADGGPEPLPDFTRGTGSI